jgi:hypothetical protein
MGKAVASTLKNVLDNPEGKVLMDLSQDATAAVDSLMGHWTVDLYSRKPGPSVNKHGEVIGTDLDLATILLTLAGRKAVINLPTYKSMRVASKREGEHVLSKDNRHGQILNMYSNENVFSFGVKIKDYNVMNTGDKGDQVGAPRNFAIVDVTGDWHPGWHSIDFVASAKENDFMRNKNLFVGSTIPVQSFVHPNRWVSLYGAPYFMTKLAIKRMEVEAKYYRDIKKQFLADGIRFPGGGEAATEWPASEKTSEGTKVSVPAWEFDIDVPEFEGKLPAVPATTDGLVFADKKAREITYGLLPAMRFAVRSIEYVFSREGFDESGLERPAPYHKDVSWEKDFVPAGRRNKYSRFVLFQPAVGQMGVAIRYRKWDKMETVSEDFAELKGDKLKKVPVEA